MANVWDANRGRPALERAPLGNMSRGQRDQHGGRPKSAYIGRSADRLASTDTTDVVRNVTNRTVDTNSTH
jgi:hypothetical protein